MEILNLDIRLQRNDLPQIISVGSIEVSSEPGFGELSLILDADHEAAYPVEGYIQVVVEDLSPGGKTSTFEALVQVLDKAEETDTEEDTETDEEATDEPEGQDSVQKAQAVQKALMDELVQSALEGKSVDAKDFSVPGELNITAKIREIDEIGRVYIDYSPKIATIPNDWEQLWSLEEREKMAPRDREAFEEELLKIMSVSYELNSFEKPQRYLYNNLTLFTEGELHIKLNFSDPLLISQGMDQADVIVIRLLKSYFLRPNGYHATQLNNGRELATLDEDESYLIIRQDIPKQVATEEEIA